MLIRDEEGAVTGKTVNAGIHAINLGDSGFMVVRDGSTMFQSPVQRYSFNFTYQLERGFRGDLPSYGSGPQITAQKIASLARHERAEDLSRQTPFSSAAQDAGIRYYGGN
ncbi:probable protein phosphatase 2C 55 [Rutidosis leptorrhynchoides]|uniref:probable protein phosphatase 2C 55 n=1 Tax=Rutidosis leptorrhynchoides TaxID=125765 RepID=UPI003A994066